MTRRDFELLASILSIVSEEFAPNGKADVLLILMRALADELAAREPAFLREKFLTRCGYYRRGTK